MLRSPPPRHSLASEYGPRAPQMSYPGVRPARSQAPGDSHVHARAAYAQVFGSLGPSARCVVQGGEMTPWRKCRNSQKKKKSANQTLEILGGTQVDTPNFQYADPESMDVWMSVTRLRPPRLAEEGRLVQKSQNWARIWSLHLRLPVRPWMSNFTLSRWASSVWCM